MGWWIFYFSLPRFILGALVVVEHGYGHGHWREKLA